MLNLQAKNCIFVTQTLRMKNCFIILFILFVQTQFINAQPAELQVKKAEKGLYLEHKVAAKESFYSLGRLYNSHPKSIAAYNKLDMTKGLAIGQSLRIPLTDTNFIQKGNKGTPVFYKVGENEGLMKVSSLHNNVSLEDLRNWNGLKDNVVRPGANLVIGFLQSKEMPSVAYNPPAIVKEEKILKEEKKEGPVKKDLAVDPKKEEPPKTSPVVVEKKESPKVEPKVETANQPVFSKQEIPTASTSGYFKQHFDLQIRQNPIRKNETVTSGIFKTTSGWLDSKYYMLIDGVQPGTIIKVTNPANSKVIYAKVLGEMSGIQQNKGYDIRISSAGASALQLTEEDKFIVKVNY